MKRNISICILVLFIIAVGVTVLMDNIDVNSNKTNAKDNTQSVDTEAMIKTNADVNDYNYYIALKNGKVVVLKKDCRSMYLETDIDSSQLSNEVIQKLNKKIGYNKLNEVYDFLESYSS